MRSLLKKMRSRKTIIFLVGFILFCSTLGFFHYQDGRRIPIEKMQELEAGMSREDVRKILGEPTPPRFSVESEDGQFASWTWWEGCNVPACPICFLSNYTWFPDSLRKRRQWVFVTFQSGLIYDSKLEYSDTDPFDEPPFSKEYDNPIRPRRTK